MKYKELTVAIINDCIKELRDLKKADYVNKTEALTGRIGLVYCCLENMYFRGKYMFPLTYKYRRELTKYLLDYMKEEAKRWRQKHF